MGRLTDNLTALIGVKNNIKDAIEEKGVDMTGVPFTSYHEKILEIEGEGGGGEEPNVPEPAKNFLVGHTLPIAIKNKTAINTFYLESDLHNITISGLDGIATVTGNGTKRVEWTVTENGNDDLIVLYTISINGETHYGRQFYYGAETDDWVVLAYKRIPEDNEIGNFVDNWLYIQTTSLGAYGDYSSTLIGGVYKSQILSVNGTKTSSAYCLSGCSSFNQPLPSGLTTVSTGFLQGCTSFNQPLPNLTGSVGSYFLKDCSSFNQPIPSGITNVGSDFLSGCSSFNHPLPEGLTGSGQDFLTNCSSFNHPVPAGVSPGNRYLSGCTSFNSNLPDAYTTELGPFQAFMSGCINFNKPLPANLVIRGASFMWGCKSFNQPLPSGLFGNSTTIPSGFLRNCEKFNQPLPTETDLIDTIGSDFLSGCSSFNQPLPFTNVSTVQGNFLSDCVAFNQPLPSLITTVGTGFLKNCISFNQALPNGITVLPNDSLYNCSVFNSSLPNAVITIGNNVLRDCPAFNQPLPPLIETIGSYFLYSGISFNQTLPLNITTIGSNFLNGNISLKKRLVFSNLISVGLYFLYGCDALNEIEWNNNVFPTGNQSLSSQNIIRHGTNGVSILLSGTYASELKTALADRTSNPYRKLEVL